MITVKITKRTMQELLFDCHIQQFIEDENNWRWDTDATDAEAAAMKVYVDWIVANQHGGEKQIPEDIAHEMVADFSSLEDRWLITKYDLNSLELALGYYEPFVPGGLTMRGGCVRSSVPDLRRGGKQYQYKGKCND